MFNSETIDFIRWILRANDLGKEQRYVYIADKDLFIDDNGNRYTWGNMFKIWSDGVMVASEATENDNLLRSN